MGEESPLGHSGFVSEGVISCVSKLESAARDDIIKGLVLMKQVYHFIWTCVSGVEMPHQRRGIFHLAGVANVPMGR